MVTNQVSNQHLLWGRNRRRTLPQNDIEKDFKLSTLDGNTLTGAIGVYGKHDDAPAFVIADDAPVTVTILNDAVFLLSVSTRKQCAVTLKTIQYMKRRSALKIRLMNKIVRQ
jgi:hypothetical protein